MPATAPRYLTTPGVEGRYYSTLGRNKMASLARMICWNNDSPNVKANSVDYSMLGSTPAFEEWTGGMSIEDIAEDKFTIKNANWQAGVRFPKMSFVEDNSGQIMAKIEDLAAGPEDLWNYKVSLLIEGGAGTSYGLAYDGQSFYDDDHLSRSSGTQKNDLAVGDVPDLQVTTPAAPTALEMSKIMVGGAQWLWKLKDDHGKPANLGAARFGVMGPANMMGAIMQACQSPQVDSGSSAISVVNPAANIGMQFVPMVNPYLTDDDVVFIHRLDATILPFILQIREQPVLNSLGVDSEYCKLNDFVAFNATVRGNIGYGQWLLSCRMQLV